jgi:hypothetical protein
MSIGVDGQRKAMAVRMARSAYPLATTEVAARTGGRHDRGEGRRQLSGFISRMEIDAMTCGCQVGDTTQQVGPAEESANGRSARGRLFPNAK